MNNGNTVVETGEKGFWQGAWGKIVSLFFYLKSFKWIVDIARWIQDTGAMMAESAFTLAIIYVIVFTFAHPALALVPGVIIAVLNQTCMIVFTVMPELVMIPTILTTAGHLSMARQGRQNQSWGWFVAYSILTLLFVALTCVLLYGLRNGFTPDDTTPTGAIFVLRCFAGLSYTVVQRLWDGKGKNVYTSLFEKLSRTIQDLRVSLSEKETALSDLQIALSQLRTSVETLEQEKVTLSLALAQKKVSRAAPAEVTTEDKKVAIGPRGNIATPQEKVTTPLEEEEIVTLEKDNITPININAHREKIKSQIIKEVQSGSNKINYKKVAKNAGVSYGTVNKYKEDIIKEISQELPAIAKENV